MSGLTQIVGSTSGVAYVASVNSSGKMKVEDSAVATLLTDGIGVTGTFYQGTQPVSIEDVVTVSSASISASNSVLEAATSVANMATQTTASTDLYFVKRCSVFGSLPDTAGSIIVQVSPNDTDWYINPEVSIFINVDGIFYNTIELDARYIRFVYVNSSGSSQTWTCNISYKN